MRPRLGASVLVAGLALCAALLPAAAAGGSTVLCAHARALAAAAIPGRPGRALLQSPGSYVDTPVAATDPWGTASGYYDPYGAGFIPGFVNVDISSQYGNHVDVGPVAVDLTPDYAGFALSNAFGVGVARNGDGFDVQLGNGNIMDMSVTKTAGFGLWLLNGLVNINIGPDGRWNVVPSAYATTGTATSAASVNATVAGMQDAGSLAATATSVSPGAAAAAAAAARASPPPSPQPPPLPAPSPSPAAARRPCEGGTIVRVEGARYLCKYLKGTAPTQGSGGRRRHL